MRGYTAFTAAHGDVSGAALAEQFAQSTRPVVEQFGGTLLELRGDEAVCIFASARQALQTALALQEQYQRDTADGVLPLGVGIGIDAGEVVPVRGGYRGRALNLAARLCSLARGGDVLASDSVLHLAGAVEGIGWADRGPVTLKGLPEPVRVVQFGRKGELTPEPPALQSLRPSCPSNLPDEPTPFIGRSHEVAAVVDLFEQPTVRLVVLTGTGGTGKTRLALGIGGRLLARFPDGVFFVSLAALTDPSLVPSAIASALNVQEEAGVDLLTTLVRHLREKQLLLILDNYEHLLPAAPDVSCLLDDCRELRILLTSRTPLHLTREHEYPVLPLALPGPEQLTDAERLSEYDAVALFIDRARAIRPDFALTAENACAVGELCIRLDGLPLAIVLAASRLRLFSPEALLRRLSNRLAVLTGGALDVPERQRTLRATLDWSYSLLSEEEQLLLARLSVFSGGCTLEAAEAVCNPDVDLDVDESIRHLIEQSLLRQEPEIEPRVGMLETIREYATEHLERRGERAYLRARHADYFLELAETADRGWSTTQQRFWLDRLEREQDDLNAAMGWMVANHDFEKAARLTAALHAYRGTRGQWTVHEAWIETLLKQDVSPSTAAWGRLLRGAGAMAIQRGDFGRADSLLLRGLAVARDWEDLPGVAATLRLLAMLAVYQGRTGDAVARLNEALDIARSSGNTQAVADCLDNLGGVMAHQGDLDLAASLMQESLDIYRQLGHQASIAEVLRDLAWLALQQRDFTAAVTLLKDSLRTARDLHHTWILTYCLEGLARAAASLGHAPQAMTLWGAVDALQEHERVQFPATEVELRQRYVRAAIEQIPDPERRRASERGKIMSTEEAIAFALNAEWDDSSSTGAGHA
jgi:predicted ATPase